MVSAGPGLSSVLGPLLSSSPLTCLSPSLEDRQMSEQIALDTRKREQFQRLKEQFVKDQEVGGLGWVVLAPAVLGLANETVCVV